MRMNIIRCSNMKNKRKTGIILWGLCILAAIAASFLVFHLWKNEQEQRIIADRGETTIVCFADSIWDICRDETGIAAQLENRLSAKVINLGIMGTTASLRSEAHDEADKWNVKSLIGLVDAVTGGEKNPLLEEDAVRTGLYDVDYSQVDYFLIAYGLNDYFLAQTRENQDMYDAYTYAGALRTAVEKLQEAYPQAKVVILSQTYCQGYSYGKVDSESDWRDWGGGTGPDYVETARKVAEEYGLIFVDNYEKMGINIYNGTKYLSDATHLSEKGRKKYAKILAEALLQDYRAHEKTEE